MLDALIALPLSAGKHTIEMKFTTAGYPVAVYITIAGIVLFAGMIAIYLKFFYFKKNGKIVVDGEKIKVEEFENPEE